MDKRIIPNINSLHKEQKIKNDTQTNIFNIVLNKCIEKILYTNKFTSNTFIIFEVPHILIGFTSYNRESCILFLMKELTKNDYKVDFIEPHYLYIDWGTKSRKNNLDINNLIPTSDPMKLKMQTEKLLKKFPNTSKIVFEYQDTTKKNKKK